MRTTINIDDALLNEAVKMTSVTEKTAVIHSALEALIALESSKRLSKLGGSMPDLEAIPRRRPQ